MWITSASLAVEARPVRTRNVNDDTLRTTTCRPRRTLPQGAPGSHAGGVAAGGAPPAQREKRVQTSLTGSALRYPRVLSMRITMPTRSPFSSKSPPPLMPFSPLMPEKMTGTGTPLIVQREAPMTPDAMRGGSSGSGRCTTPTGSPAKAGLARMAANWTADAKYVDPLMSGDGHDGVDALIAGVQQKFPDFKFSLIGEPNGFVEHARFSWGLGPDGADSPIKGTDFAVLSKDGRNRSITGFLDQVPQA